MNAVQSEHSDELLGELDASMQILGRLMVARHEKLCADTMLLAGPRFLLLRILQEGGPQKAGDLAHALGVKAPATSSLIDGLEHDGFVSREHVAEDRRVVLVSATPKGLDALDHSERLRRGQMRAHLSVLSEDDVRALIRIQRTLIDSLVERDS
jgi:DNA-binding MarR family transcriptional regulator